MAKLVLTNEFVSLNGTDVSSYCRKAELTIEVEAKDVTTFASGGWKEEIGGLKSGTLALEFEQDFAAAALDSILWPLLGTVVTFDVKPVNAARSTSNPSYTGSVLVAQWNPLTGSVGDDAKVTVSFPTTGAVTRQVV